MAPLTPLAIATGAVNRLVKERELYKKELVGQEAKLKISQEEFDQDGNEKDENAEFRLKQEKEALRQTQNVFPPLSQKIADTVLNLKAEISSSEAEGGHEEEVANAKKALENSEKAT